jgi:hypothetical protein
LSQCGLVVCRLRQPAGSRPGMPGNFLLLAQKKVTKEKSHTFELFISIEDLECIALKPARDE